ncbi:hypothetical protein QT513_08435, partial [Metapseudomonas otitidis]
MSFNPLISLARNAKRQRMEMQCDPQWVLDLAAERDQLYAELRRVQAENQRLRGLQPEFPPRPPEGSGLPRYGLRWNGPQLPLSVPMDDGYWTPWHLADQLRAELEAIRGQQAVAWVSPDVAGGVRWSAGALQ